MNFYMPTRIFSESCCISNHGYELAALGSHALIVTGKNSSKVNGALDDVIAALKQHLTAYTVFDEVEENPSVETVMAARELGVSRNADFVIGIGGGSALDAAKAAALMIKNCDSSWELMYMLSPGSALPVAAVPTTCGTGSEATGVAVLTRHDLKTKVSIKHKIFPQIALIDGKYLMTAPRKIIVNTAVDALAHLIESGVISRDDTYCNMSVFAGLKEWAECRPYIEGSETLDLNAAQKLMNASTLAGISIAQTGTTIPHALSYMLTYEAGIPHGAAVGAFQSRFLKHAPQKRQNAILGALGFKDTDDLGEYIAKLAPVYVPRELLERSAKAVMSNKAKIVQCPYPITESVMEDIIKI